MSGLSIPVLLLTLTLSVVALALLPHYLGRTDVVVGGDDPQVREGLQRVRRRFGTCLVLALVVLVGGVTLNGLVPAGLGVPLALAPGLAASLALLGFASWPARPSQGAGPTSASLARREAWSYGSRGLFVTPAVVAVVYLVALAVAAFLASPDDHGLMRAFSQTQGSVFSSATPFPGSFYGAPLAFATVLLAISTYAALRRMAASATILPGAVGNDALVDQRWREIATRIIVRISTAALLGYAGGTFVVAGSAMHRTSDFTVNGGYLTPWSAAGWVVTGVGLVGVVAAVVVSATGIAAALSLRGQAVRPRTVLAGQPR